MTQENQEAAAAAIVVGKQAATNLTELHGRLAPCFARVELWEQAGKYMAALMSELPRKNGWSIAEHVGDATPDRTQRLLNHATWDEQSAQGIVRAFVAEQLEGQPLRVGALDESGQEKQGEHTAGGQRQYMGCAGRVANGVNTVYCSYATPGGHALVGARVYLPAGQLVDPERRAELGIGEDVEFKTKPALATELLADMRADATLPPWVAGDEVYGRSSKLRGFCEETDTDTGYVMRVGCAFHLELAAGVKMRADEALARYATEADSWQTYSVTGSKGERRYRWAWLATRSDRHFLLVRQHLDTGELAYHYCYVPPQQPVTLPTLVHVACLRWPVEEDFEFGKDHFGLDQSQVRLYTALSRHIVLTMAALAVCAITAAEAKSRAPAPILPTSPDEAPPQDPGLIALTVAEIKRLFVLLTQQAHERAHHLRWHFWRRRHQARAQWFHHRTRLRRQALT